MSGAFRPSVRGVRERASPEPDREVVLRHAPPVVLSTEDTGAAAAAVPRILDRLVELRHSSVRAIRPRNGPRELLPTLLAREARLDDVSPHAAFPTLARRHAEKDHVVGERGEVACLIGCRSGGVEFVEATSICTRSVMREPSLAGRRGSGQARAHTASAALRSVDARSPPRGSWRGRVHITPRPSEPRPWQWGHIA